MTTSLRLILEYDGTPFIGWQHNPQGVSIQSVVESALATWLRCKDRVAVTAAGRTDAGVHAKAQVASFTLPQGAGVDPADADALRRMHRGLNGLLPPEVAVRQVAVMPEGFQALRCASGKWYRYHLLNRPEKSPLMDAWTWHHPRVLDAAVLDRLARPIVGEHDFAGFRGSKCNARTTVRRIDQVTVTRQEDGLLTIDFHGNGFLKHMVRGLVGTLLDMANGRLPETTIATVLARGDRREAGMNVPAKGLCLMRVYYPPPFDTPLAFAGEDGPF